ncbi:hypothetical protein [Mycobacteroides chelonae]|uniref:Uncharacterized protein n=1 Tax=Mycobacteroides chelonae TaxID=1774 RepID=A0AB73TWC0_MYCCH|nr:hypothetical protein [Mycobacteroides chelonae]OLT79069.1 hypothetical protein BKG57_14720 [Mycobacteroides chelonae]QDF68780.1 hypothetical protein FJK96_00320 [Mycobacteroides chelonae]
MWLKVFEQPAPAFDYVEVGDEPGGNPRVGHDDERNEVRVAVDGFAAPAPMSFREVDRGQELLEFAFDVDLVDVGSILIESR